MAASLFLVGVASFLFHATLRQMAQFSDDLSMLFLAASLIQRLYCAKQPHFRAGVITAVIYGITCAASAFYVQSGNLMVHTSLFAAMLTFVWPRTLYLISLHAGSAEAKSRLFGKFKSAYLRACQELRNLRKSVGLPWAWLLELHGWWHILTAVGAAQYMELISNLC
ncbi:hypothetical protein UA08_09326 [Talaromyces atroroseus]|uniref:Alkaline ceramidase 3 n=1 Tax=Talaromyces atroroseus TaxID=1441469 RepID=A0A1Q5Q6F1_TALAT|nr:hypothetical protein UA08_09326 [Talaromyces atroroseus]OKL55422.1 hypothetical protein UA08_09326 [Talaromyces atroroseus]